MPLSPTTPTDPGVLREQIAAVRAAGFAESINDRGAGRVGIAALEIPGPAERYSAQTRAAWIEAATGGAARISAALGFRPGSAEVTAP